MITSETFPIWKKANRKERNLFLQHSTFLTYGKRDTKSNNIYTQRFTFQAFDKLNEKSNVNGNKSAFLCSNEADKD